MRQRVSRRGALLRASLESLLDATQIGLTAQLLPDSVTGGRKEVLLQIDTRSLQLSAEETAKGGTVATTLITVATFFQNQPKLAANLNDLKLSFTETRLPDGTARRLLDSSAGG